MGAVACEILQNPVRSEISQIKGSQDQNYNNKNITFWSLDKTLKNNLLLLPKVVTSVIPE